jgi:putative transposase
MARPLRIEYEGAIYHVTARGNERQKIYFTKKDYEKFLEYVESAKKKYGIIIHCYVLMTNHYHLIIETPAGNLGKAMHHIGGSYTTYINRKRKRSGHLFQGRYKAIVVDKDSYLMELSRYVHLNPVRAGMVERPEEYRYSSYSSYIEKGDGGLVNREMVLNMLSPNKRAARRMYKAFVESGVGQDIGDPLSNVYGGMILGSNKFINGVLKKMKIEMLQRDETSHRRVLQAEYGMEEIDAMVSEAFKNKMRTNGRETRKVAVYLMKKYTGATNRQIGEYMGELSYSGVAKMVERFKGKMKTDRELREKVERIEKKMSNVKG